MNHMYTVARNRSTGRPYITKSAGVEAYQLVVTSTARRARPADWVAPAQIRVQYRFYVKRDIDCDNALKALNDALAIALGVNDKVFLPCVLEKSTGHRDPYVMIMVDPV